MGIIGDRNQFICFHSEAQKIRIPFYCDCVGYLDRKLEIVQRLLHYASSGEMFEDLRGLLTSGKGTSSRAELAKKHGISPGAIDVAIHRLRQRFGLLLREQIMRTVSSPNEVEEELRHLISIIDI